MTTETLTLSDFLLARIAEDEAVAKDEIARQEKWPVPAGAAYAITMADIITPARVLAECEARRRLVNYAAFMLKAWEDKPRGAYPDMTRRERHTANVVLAALGLPYEGHPDYDESWRP